MAAFGDNFIVDIKQWSGVPDFQKECYREGTLNDLVILANARKMQLNDQDEDGETADDAPMTKEILCHKLIVASCSQFLKPICRSVTSKMVNLDDSVQYDHAKAWIDAMYFGFLRANYADIPLLIAAAKLLQIDDEILTCLAVSMGNFRARAGSPLDYPTQIRVLDLLDSLAADAVEGQFGSTCKAAAYSVAVELTSALTDREEDVLKEMNATSWKYILTVFGEDFPKIITSPVVHFTEAFPYIVKDDESGRTFNTGDSDAKDMETASISTDGGLADDSWTFTCSPGAIFRKFANWTLLQDIGNENVLDCLALAVQKLEVSHAERLLAFEVYSRRPGLEGNLLWLASFHDFPKDAKHKLPVTKTSSEDAQAATSPSSRGTMGSVDDLAAPPPKKKRSAPAEMPVPLLKKRVSELPPRAVINPAATRAAQRNQSMCAMPMRGAANLQQIPEDIPQEPITTRTTRRGGTRTPIPYATAIRGRRNCH